MVLCCSFLLEAHHRAMERHLPYDTVLSARATDTGEHVLP